MPSFHYPLSASGASRWMRCPGSVAMLRQVTRVPSEDAAQGTAAHTLAERCLRTGDDPHASIGEGITVDGFTIDIDEEMAEGVEQYCGHVRRSMSERTNAILSVECQFNLDWLCPDLGGTADAIVEEPFGDVVVHDLKYGMVQVDAEENEQAMIYALGAVGKYGGGAEVVTVAIHQVRVSDEPKTWRIATPALLDWAEKVLRPAAERALSPTAPLVAGEVQCRWCDAAAVCPKLHREVALACGLHEAEHSPGSLPSADALTVPQLARLLAFSGAVGSFVKAATSRARRMLEANEVTPEALGAKLVEGRRTRKWRDESKVLLAVEALGDKAWTRKILSPAQMEKELKAAGASKATVTRALAPLIEETRGISMVPLTDERPAIQPAASAFADVPTTA